MNFPPLRNMGVPPAFAGWNSNPATAKASTPSGASDVRAEFDKLASRTPAEQMRDAYLKRMGLTEEKLQAMPPNERAQVEKQLQQLIEQDMRHAAEKGAKPGSLADVTA